MRGGFLVGLMLALVLPGCIGGAVNPDSPLATLNAAPAQDSSLDLVGTNCKEGGGHSVHPKDFEELPKPWVPADIMDDVGPQVVWSEAPNPVPPAKGSTFGNWHVTVVCEKLTFHGRELKPAFFGYVGERIEPPAFDTSPGSVPDHEYLVTVVATADDELLKAFVDHGITAMKATYTWTTYDTPQGALEEIVMTTATNGEYTSVQKWEPWGEPTKHTRVWFQDTGKELPHGHDGHTPKMRATPVSFDMWTAGGTHLVATGQGYFSHTGTEHHGAAPSNGHVAAVAYDGFSRTWSWGPAYPAVVLDTVWDH